MPLLGSIKHPWNFVFIFALFFARLRGTQLGFCPALAPGWPEITAGTAFFLGAAFRGQKCVCRDIFGPNAAGHKLVMPLFLGGGGGVLGSSVPRKNTKKQKEKKEEEEKKKKKKKILEEGEEQEGTNEKEEEEEK